MFFSVISSIGLVGLLFSSYSINSNDTILLSFNENSAVEYIDSAGLYDPETLALYNATSNEETLFLTDYYQTYYFNKLGSNIGNNTKGSCGFVATAMLLSFWDTYWDDNIIAENFEAKTQLSESYIDLDAEAPGIIQEPTSVAYANDAIYDDYIEQYADVYFHFKLIDLYRKNISDREPGAYGMGYQDYIDLFNYYAYVYLGYSASQVTVFYSDTNVRNLTISLIKQGIPVKLSIGNGTEGHAVIAYDYDEATDNIYCNFGWGSDSTHVTIEQMDFNEYTNVVAFYFRGSHINHSNSYTYNDGNNETTTYCACWSCIPNNITITSGNYLDETPTFEWTSLINERWFENLSLSFTFSILNSSQYELFYATNIYEPKYTLSESAWNIALSASGKSYYIYVGLESSVSNYWDEYYCLQLFYEPTDYNNKIQIKPSDWGFEQRYWFANESGTSDEYKETSLLIDGLTIVVQRLRCGYIENQYVNLSPRRENAGVAYLRLIFSKAVYSYMFGASFWSASENLDGVAVVRVMDSYGDWQSIENADFNLRTIGLSTTRSQIQRYVGTHTEGIYGLEFYATATATGDRNKGRICIDDIVLNTDPNDLDFISTNYSSIG